MQRVWRAAFAIFRKDLQLELRTRELTTTSVFFAVLVCVLSSVAFFADRATAPGAIWIPITFASVLSLSRTWQRERDDGALTALVLAPVPRVSIYLGKVATMLGFLLVIELLVVPLVALLFHLDLGSYALKLVLLGGLGALGIALVGTLFGVLTVRSRARDLMLSSIVLPLLTPLLLITITATIEILSGATFAELRDYWILLGVYDIAALLGGCALFGFLIEE